MPIMHLIPYEETGKKSEEGVYKCPLYKVVSRSGTLSTTGHSTNFVMYLDLPTQTSADDWICSGVAAFLALRY
jgi:dynein heavy chain